VTTLGSGTCAGLLLAAGAGTRMGNPKALVALDGELLVDRAATVLRDGGCEPVTVVLGAEADQVRRCAGLGDAVVVDNPAWESGQASSLRVGLEALSAPAVDDGAAPAAVLVAVVDQPGLTAAVVRRLINCWRSGGAPVAVAGYAGRPRNPVLFDATLLSEVAEAVTGDEGARGWLAERRATDPASVVIVECGDVGDPTDVDTPDDLARWEQTPATPG
jgi:nicotine blue oxidoreductase